MDYVGPRTHDGRVVEGVGTRFDEEDLQVGGCGCEAAGEHAAGGTAYGELVGGKEGRRKGAVTAGDDNVRYIIGGKLRVGHEKLRQWRKLFCLKESEGRIVYMGLDEGTPAG